MATSRSIFQFPKIEGDASLRSAGASHLKNHSGIAVGKQSCSISPTVKKVLASEASCARSEAQGTYILVSPK